MGSFTISKKELLSMSNIEVKKYVQSIQLLKALYLNGPTSTAGICQLLRISTPTGLALINEMLASSLLKKNGLGKSIGGRKPELFHLNDESFYILTVDVEKEAIKMLIVDNNHKHITSISMLKIAINRDPAAVDIVCESIEKLIQSSGIRANLLLGIGLSMPGLINSKLGENHTYMIPNAGVSLRSVLVERLKVPVYIENDVKCSALAELKFGLAKNKKDVLVLMMDRGIGLGIIMDGALRAGTSGYSGEIGHMPFVEDGELCYCGKQGCLETVASGAALVKIARQGIGAGQSSLLNELSHGNIENISPQLIVEAANNGDQYTIGLLSEMGNRIGKAISALIQIFNPELVILGGQIAQAKQYITVPIQQSINTYCLPAIREQTKVVLSNLGEEAQTLGIASLVIENLLDEQANAAMNG